MVSHALRSEGLAHSVVSPGTVLRGAKAQSREDDDELICGRGRPPKALPSVNKSKRVSLATGNKNMSWSRVMFSDRCKVAFRYPGCVLRSVRRMKRSQVHEDVANKPSRPSVYNVYGGVTRHGTTKLHSVTRTTGQNRSAKNKQGTEARNVTQAEYQ